MCHEHFCPKNCRLFYLFVMLGSSTVICSPKTPVPPCSLESCFEVRSVCSLKVCKHKLRFMKKKRFCYRKTAHCLYFRLCRTKYACNLFLTFQSLSINVALGREGRNFVKNIPVFGIQQKCQNNYMKTNSAWCLHLQL